MNFPYAETPIVMEDELEKYKRENADLKKEIERLKNSSASNTYKVIFEASPDILIQLNADYKIIVIHIPNIEEERVNTVVGKDIFDVTPEYTHVKMKNALTSVFRDGEVVKYFSEGETMGSYRYYDNYLSPIKDAEGNITTVYFRSRDITAQKIAEKVLLDNERKLKTVYENSIQFLTVLDLDRKFIWFNKNARDRSPAVFGKDLIVGEVAESYIAKEYRTGFVENFNKAVAGETITYTRKYALNNAPFFLELSLAPVYNNDNTVVGVALTGINVTKHKEYEDYLKRINLELVQQNEKLNQYSYIISHNLRGPIATLMGLVQVFEQCRHESDQLDEIMRHVYKSAVNLDSIIKDLNTVVTNSGQEGNLKTTIDLKEECEGIIFLLASQIEKASAEFIIDFEQYPILFSIKSYIHSILYNLIYNAIKYRRTHVTPVIRIQSYIENDGMLCIECTDNGLGIDLDKFGSRLFGFYKRFHTHVEGKGLGLHLVKKQVELLGGRIEVQSVVDEGSTFRIFLPK
jgi:PAS domain S-box-containing protein